MASGEQPRDGPLLSHAGIATFLRSPSCTFAELQPGMFAVYGAPSDWTLGTRPGARYGPRAIRDTSTHLAWYLETSRSNSLLDVRSGRTISLGANANQLVDVGDVAIYPVDVERTVASIQAAQSAVLEAGAFPILLGGDHFVTYPAVLAQLEHAERLGRHLGFIQFDAHFDLVDDNPVFGRYYHGSLSRRIAELPYMRAENMAWIGINGYARVEQLDFVLEGGGAVFTRADIRRRGIEGVVADALAHAGEGCEEIYVSIDIDVLDGGLAPGAGSINIDGCSPGELLDAVDLLSEAAIAGLDLVEVSPLLDSTEYTARVAAVALTNFICARLPQANAAGAPHDPGPAAAGHSQEPSA
jgi:agmatinase